MNCAAWVGVIAEEVGEDTQYKVRNEPRTSNIKLGRNKANGRR